MKAKAPMKALDLLRRRVAAIGQGGAARELGFSRAAVSQILSGKYKARAARIEARVLAVYGAGERLTCPHTGEEMTPAECAARHERAALVGRRATGNPETFRRLLACLGCEIRS